MSATSNTIRTSGQIGPVATSQMESKRSMVTGVVHQAPTPNMHYGFLRFANLHHDVFVPQRIIKEAAAQLQFVCGAQVLCDIEHRQGRGFRVIKIHSVTSPS